MCTFCEHVNSLSLHLSAFKLKHCVPGAPLTHFNDGGGGGPSDFFGSEILAQSDLFGSMKDAGIFLGREKKQRDFFGLRKKD